ncbi:MOSC domain-containing protein [Nocardioides aequoreus]|uniref:MOSC domain-containing protein n=1 Tax=Nocardioides aequoreus TaxID=397278 RepID=UPI001B805730|nr:MOSC domain-containing protein [Nocardioides aequoreus]
MSTLPPATDSDPALARRQPDPVLTAIHLAPGRRLPVRAVGEARAETGHGLTGDRYEDARHRHLTVQSATQLADAAARWGRPIEPGSTRRNLTLSHGEVPTTPGARLRVGELELEVVRVAAPCRILDDSVGPGAAEALRRRAGAVCRVLTGGDVRVGDVVTFL